MSLGFFIGPKKEKRGLLEMKIKCNKCKNEIKRKGAILWSDPDKNDMCKKTHLCRKCYHKIIKIINMAT